MNRDYLIIGLLVTEGKRDITSSLVSMEMQTRNLDRIVIASETFIDSKYRVYVNDDENGLAINTTQALNKIWIENYVNDIKIYIATLDDDDTWEKDYIKNAEKLLQEGHNFITGCVSIVVDGVQTSIECPKSNKENDYYLYDNDGNQGSNKIFDLEIALENGAMFKTINSSTDRVLNTNLLSDARTSFATMNEVIAIQNRDTNRNRITNDANRIENIREFYKVKWNILDKTKIDEINERHNKLHGFKKVIIW